jgi:hypothetical protein
VRRPPGRAKPDAASDGGGGGGACAALAPTPTAGLAGLRLPHVASTCFKYFVGMFQVFYEDVTKVDRDVAYIVRIVHVCCKCLFPMFHYFLDVYCNCVYADVFMHMLQVFYLDVAYVCNCFSSVFYVCFACVLGACFECFSCFRT